MTLFLVLLFLIGSGLLIGFLMNFLSENEHSSSEPRSFSVPPVETNRRGMSNSQRYFKT